MPRAHAIPIGRLRRFTFPAGTYVYVGSAQRNLQARVARRARRRKPLRWQVDYVSVRAEFLGALMIESPQSLEYQLAALLTDHGPFLNLRLPSPA